MAVGEVSLGAKAKSGVLGEATLGISCRRALLKISGEALMGERGFGLDSATLKQVAVDILHLHESGVELCLVIGGGNIFRGVSEASADMERASADHMGMLATVINSLAVQNMLEKLGLQVRVLSAIPMSTVCEPFIRRRAVRHLERGRVVIFAAGTGNPYFTTDTAAALRAAEMGCDLMIKGTQVDGVYDRDPRVNEQAQHFARMHYDDVLQRNLQVMDAAAIALARDNDLPVIICSMQHKGGFLAVLEGKGKYTIIDRSGEPAFI